ncbi:MAG: transposase [Acidobacteriota bacterium]|nr:transposase [Acidobacteriota bacterium]
MIRSYKFRLYPTKAQVAVFEQWLELCRELYNAALQERRDAWKLNRVSITRFEQERQFTEVKQIREDIDQLNSKVCREQLIRLDKRFQVFFQSIKNGKKAGYPRFKGKSRFQSFTFNDVKSFRVGDNKLFLSKIGKIKIKLHREIEGKIKTVTIKRDCGKWFAIFAVECESKLLSKSESQIGIDVGLKNFATLSNGETIENPRYFETAQMQLRKAQRKISRRKKGSKRCNKARFLVKKIHEKIRRQRADFQHKQSRELINNFGLIAVEDLSLTGLGKSRLAKQIKDAAWGSFFQKLAYKAESAGRVVVKVNPRNTSQNCSGCGLKVEKTLPTRIHDCKSCGLVLDRDENAAINILRLGSSLQAIT